jgi:hypothetical protein
MCRNKHLAQRHFDSELQIQQRAHIQRGFILLIKILLQKDSLMLLSFVSDVFQRSLYLG